MIGTGKSVVGSGILSLSLQRIDIQRECHIYFKLATGGRSFGLILMVHLLSAHVFVKVLITFVLSR